MKYYRLLTLFPPLPDSPQPPPIKLATVIDAYREELEPADLALALALLAELDCRNLESLLLGRPIMDERAPMSLEQLTERRDLPEWMERFLERWDSGACGGDYPLDALWTAWLAALVELAERSGNLFLNEWVAYEVALRDALAQQRAEALGEKPEQRRPGVDLNAPESHVAMLAALAEIRDPMERERLIDRARLLKLENIAGSDPFSTDAALALLAGVMILDRWDLGDRVKVESLLEVFV